MPGSFVHFIDGKAVGRGLITICDLSLICLKFKVDYEYDFSIGDLLRIRFHLDDLYKTAIDKKVVIKNINMPFIDTAFLKTDKEDETLALYLQK